MATYYVTSQYNTCESDPSLQVSASCSLGIPETSTLVMIKIEPNPVSGIVEISSDFLIKTIRITDLFGRQQSEIDNIGLNKIRIDLSDLKNGIYLLSIQTHGGQSVQKLIVEH
jgi:hypothetical protein